MKEFFTILKYLTWEKKPWKDLNDLEKESFNSYMVNRYISMYPEYVELVNLVQNISYNEKEKIYNIYLNLLPKKNVYLKYIKSSKKDISNELIDKLSFYFDISKREIREYLPLLSKDIIKEILLELGTEDKIIKKLVK